MTYKYVDYNTTINLFVQFFILSWELNFLYKVILIPVKSQWNSKPVPIHKKHGRFAYPDCKIHGANVGPTWVLSAPGGPHVGPINLAIRVVAGIYGRSVWLMFTEKIHNDTVMPLFKASSDVVWTCGDFSGRTVKHTVKIPRVIEDRSPKTGWKRPSMSLFYSNGSQNGRLMAIRRGRVTADKEQNMVEDYI